MKPARRLLGVLLAGLALAWLRGAAPLEAGPLDPDDRAKVAEIDGKVDNQLDGITDARSALDDLVEAGELAKKETGVLLELNRAQLLLDLERMLIRSCAPRCAKAPAPAPGATSAKRCFKCASPRLMVQKQHGGYLEDVLALVATDLGAVVDAGLPLDTVRAGELLDAAGEALAQGDGESSFSLACMAYGTLACDPSLKAPEPAGGVGSRGFAGQGGAR